MNYFRRIAPVALVVLCLTGCFTQEETVPPTFKDLSRASDVGDRYPDIPERSISVDIDIDSSRMVGIFDDYTLYLSRVSGSEETCITAYASPSLWTISCGLRQYEAEVDSKTLLIAPDDVEEKSEWVRISGNVYQTS